MIGTDRRLWQRRLGALLVVAVLSFHVSAATLFAQSRPGTQHWVGTWATSLVARAVTPPAPAGQPAAAPTAGQPAPAAPLQFNNQTLRQIVHVSIGGPQVRVVFSNTFGTAPLAVGAASIAIRDKGAAIVASSKTPLTFSGKSLAAIAPGAVLVSDPAILAIPDMADVAVDLYLPGDTTASKSPLSHHTGNGAVQTNYVSPQGNHTGVTDMPVMTTTLNWHFMSRVDVTAPPQSAAVVAFGDSITAGSRSTPDTNNRWPDHLARRLLSRNIRMGVLNAGISGNRLLGEGNSQSALARFDRDVLAQTGATQVVALLGVNDVGNRQARATADDLIAGHRQLIARAHARGLTIYGVTMTPFEGATLQPEYWTPEGEATRQAFNKWVRSGGEFDGVIDFDMVLRDPAEPSKLLAKYSSPDHLHPNDAGYEALGAAAAAVLAKRPESRRISAR
jgi:lysophospholipase L1-like esterase